MIFFFIFKIKLWNAEWQKNMKLIHGVKCINGNIHICLYSCFLFTYGHRGVSVIKIMLRFSQIALTHSKQNWKSVKRKGLCKHLHRFLFEQEGVLCMLGCSIRSLVICRLLTLLFIKCAFHKWHRSSLWPLPSQTLTYYVGCDQATNRLGKTYLQANAQSSEEPLKKKKKNSADISYKIFAQEWHSCIMESCKNHQGLESPR